MTDVVRVPAGITVVRLNGQWPVWTNPYEIDAEPVTNLEYRAFLTASGRKPSGWYERGVLKKELLPREGTLADPATDVSWSEAKDYASWRGKRLPTWVELLRAAMGESHWKASNLDDLRTWYLLRKMQFVQFASSGSAQGRWRATERATEEANRLILSLAPAESNPAISLRPLFEWCLESVEDTVDRQEVALAVPQLFRMYPYSLAFDGLGGLDARATAFRLGQYISGFNLEDAKEALQKRVSTDAWGTSLTPSPTNRTVFAPGAFLDSDSQARQNHRSMMASIPGGYGGGRIGFRCVKSGPELSPYPAYP